MSNQTKFYQAIHANQIVNAGKHQLQFRLTEHAGGCWWGVYATDDAELIAELDKLAGKKKVFVLTEKEYANALKKANSALNEIGSTLLHSQNSARTVDATHSPIIQQIINPDMQPVSAPSQVIQSTDDALTVGKVA